MYFENIDSNKVILKIITIYFFMLLSIYALGLFLYSTDNFIKKLLLQFFIAVPTAIFFYKGNKLAWRIMQISVFFIINFMIFKLLDLINSLYFLNGFLFLIVPVAIWIMYYFFIHKEIEDLLTNYFSNVKIINKNNVLQNLVLFVIYSLVQYLR